MKGVIASLAPTARVIDLTHDLPPGDIRGGAFALAASCRFFPKGTVHVAVVDPGAGSLRKAIAVQTANGVFVGPDNGVLSWALAKEKIKAIHALENEAYFLRPVSRTFHGRDVFAPVAGLKARWFISTASATRSPTWRAGCWRVLAVPRARSMPSVDGIAR